MKLIYLIIFFSSTTFFLIPDFNYTDKTEVASLSKEEMVNILVEEEVEFAAARCFCRVGEDRGQSVKEYGRPYIKGIEMNKTYNFQNKKNEDDCSRRCSAAAYRYFKSLNKDQICALLKKSGTTTIRAYSKVGTRPYTVCQTLGTVTCCLGGGGVTCPNGWESESTNFPGYCSKAVCQPLVPGDRRLYNDNGTVWGFIWQGWIYQLRKGTTSASVWSSCR